MAKDYTCSYKYKGYDWEFQIKAESMEEAAQRIEMIRKTSQLDGEVIGQGSILPYLVLVTAGAFLLLMVV